MGEGTKRGRDENQNAGKHESFDVSVILCTYNRCDLLPKALESLLAQDDGRVRYELLVVDNNSTDRTREVCESLLTQSRQPARYIFEPKQGVSYARNAALAVAKAPIIAFTDDDVCVRSDWVASIKRAFDKHPSIDGVGGKVLPRWGETPPAWLTRRHWTPLALQDYGDAPLLVNTANPLCLVAANLAVRRDVFDRIGLFLPDLQRVQNSIGSMEDLELHLRLWAAGRQELYVPDVVVTAPVQPERLTKAYHRRWYRGNGHFYALLRDQELERSAARLFDVPAHLYRQTLIDLVRRYRYQLSGKEEEAFLCEARLQFFAGFFRERRAAFRRSDHPGILREVTTFLYSLASASASASASKK
jgi:glycosyltransferase involved in cell wall biosynthesis